MVYIIKKVSTKNATAKKRIAEAVAKNLVRLVQDLRECTSEVPLRSEDMSRIFRANGMLRQAMELI